MVLPSGTNIEAALLSAAARFGPEEDRTRIIILVTDGEQTVPGHPIEVGARACAAKGLRVYAIGVGQPEGAFIRLPPEQGGGILRDMLDRPVRTRLDETTLMEIARVAGGRYWRAETAGQLQEVFNTIAALERASCAYRQVRYEARRWPSGLICSPKNNLRRVANSEDPRNEREGHIDFANPWALLLLLPAAPSRPPAARAAGELAASPRRAIPPPEATVSEPRRHAARFGAYAGACVLSPCPGAAAGKPHPESEGASALMCSSSWTSQLHDRAGRGPEPLRPPSTSPLRSSTAYRRWIA